VGDEPLRLDRRSFLAGVVAAVALAGCSDDNTSDAGAEDPTTSLLPIPEDLPRGLFSLGVASGDPMPRSIILWTRLVADPAAADGGVGADPLPVKWEVASDEDFVDRVIDGTVIASADLAHSVHVEADHLQPDNWYWYRFSVGNVVSPVGRTRTAPADDKTPNRLRFAFASCQNRQDGFWTAYEHMADEDLDLVVFLGDYIYEDAPDPNSVRPYVSAAPVDLATYRQRWAEYKTDRALQDVHHRFPWVVTWDDHEVANDYAADLPSGLAPGDEAGREQFLQRRAFAYQAFYEHQPVRLDPPEGAGYRTHREQLWGKLVRFFVLDGRQYRSDQACTDQAVLGGVGAICADAEGDDRTMLGPQQEDWLGEGLSTSEARWNVVANQTVVAHVPVAGQGADALVNLDQWDGYPAARRRLVAQLREARNPVVITGDIHLGGAGVITADPDDLTTAPVATELVGTSISSAFPYAELVEQATASLPNIRYLNARQRGYVVCTVKADELQAEFKVVSTVDRPESRLETDATFVIDDGDPDPHR
jgi:alkaline phosphatase D